MRRRDCQDVGDIVGDKPRPCCLQEALVLKQVPPPLFLRPAQAVRPFNAPPRYTLPQEAILANVVKGLRCYLDVIEDTMVPQGFVVPDEEPWPRECWGQKLGWSWSLWVWLWVNEAGNEAKRCAIFLYRQFSLMWRLTLRYISRRI